MLDELPFLLFPSQRRPLRSGHVTLEPNAGCSLSLEFREGGKEGGRGREGEREERREAGWKRARRREAGWRGARQVT
jgi:hypothetical protein